MATGYSHQDYHRCLELFDAGETQIIYHEMLADTQTAVAAMMKLSTDTDYACLLESVEGGEVRGRFSVIAIEPDLIWRCKNGQVEINRQAMTAPDSFEPVPCDDPFQALRDIQREGAMSSTAPLPSMAAGLFGYFGYDMVRHMENLPDANPRAIDTYDAVLMRPSVVAIFDRLKDTITLATQIRADAYATGDAAWSAAKSRLTRAEQRLNDALPTSSETMAPAPLVDAPSANVSEARYKEMVRQAKEYIKSGDIFQVVLSQRFSMPFSLPAMELYRSLRRLNPSPFLFYFTFGDLSVVGSSPEILVRLRNEEVTIRPIAGTRKRGQTAEEDATNAADLLADMKERAEHLMLLDLGRNDVGRVSQVGSVRVISDFEIELYSHVMHIASEVTGRIRPEFDAFDAMAAGFPAGTVSGSPKIRAMEIIDELEADKRGVYAGAIGYISANGEMDTCIALRTAVLKDDALHIQAGAGIVYDSVEQSEFEECQNKARAVIRAAEVAIELAQARSANHRSDGTG